MIIFSNLFLNQDVYFGMNCQKTNWTQKGFSYVVCSCKKLFIAILELFCFEIIIYSQRVSTTKIF